MQVFSQQMATRDGRPLPLSYYMKPTLLTTEKEYSFDPFTVKLSDYNLYEALRHDKGFPTVVTFLLGGVDVNLCDKSGATLLHIAVARIINITGNKNSEDNNNNSNLLSSECPNQLVISFLIDNGANLNARNMAGETPLMIAASTQNIAALRLLLTHGADPNIRDDMGHTVLYHAAKYPYILQILQAWVEDLPVKALQEGLLHNICRQGGGVEFAALFLIEQLGVSVNAREGENTISTVTENKSDNTTNSTISNNHSAFNITTSVTVRDGFTPLHCAILAGDPSLVRTLLLKGAEVDKPSATGIMPIQLAADCAFSSNSNSSSSECFILRLCRLLLLLFRNNGSVTRSTNTKKVYALLNAYRSKSSSTERENLLQRDALSTGISLCQFNTSRDVIIFILAAIIPHLFLALCTLLTSHWWVSVFVAIFCLSWCIIFNQRDANVSNARPLRSLGLFIGYTITLSVCCMMQFKEWANDSINETSQYYHYYYWFIITCISGSIGCLLLFFMRGTATVESTATQRIGIYKAIFHSKGALADDVRLSIDIHSMVKKPLRAQYCQHTDRVIPRFDHYSTWLASSIGGNNHRLYVFFLIFYTFLLTGFFFASKPTSINGGVNDIMKSTSESVQLFMDIYIIIILPITLLFFLFTLLQQLWYISRGVTSYDVTYPSRSPWCFVLGSRTYSLFDAGFSENISRFFLLREDFLARNYRMPVMSARLQRMIKQYQAMQYSPCQEGHCHSHKNGNHGHSHGGELEELCQHQHHFDYTSKENKGHSEVPMNSNTDINTLNTTNTSTPTPNMNSTNTNQSITVTSSGAENVSGMLFQLMVQNNSTEIGNCAELQSGISPAEWQESLTRAQDMFQFFKNTMNSSK